MTDDLVTDRVGLAVERLRAGGMVAIPTETVYGLAADAENASAVARIFEVKGRPADHPLIVHLAEPDAIHDGWIDPLAVAHVLEAVKLLASTCWPGPLTMLVPRGQRVIDAVTGGRPTVGVRVPAHSDAQRLLAAFGGGVAAPSANRYGRVSPTAAEHVVDDIGPLLDRSRDVIFDGGRSTVGVESTIVDLVARPPQVLRAGAITSTEIAALLNIEVHGASGPSRTSGMLASHYAPSCRVVLANDAVAAERESQSPRHQGKQVRVLDRTDDLVAAAFELYSDLRAADTDHIDVLIVVVPAADGIGHAIRDRLVKAAAGSGHPPSRAG